MKYVKRPVTIEAVQWTGENIEEIKSFTEGSDRIITFEMGISTDEKFIKIKTLEGTMVANLNDYIIKGVQGEFYPCKPDIFMATYDKNETSYVDRFITEYHELTMKIGKLSDMLTKYKDGTLPFTPNCPYEVLYTQLIHMQNYRAILIDRAIIENINLTCSSC